MKWLLSLLQSHTVYGPLFLVGVLLPISSFLGWSVSMPLLAGTAVCLFIGWRRQQLLGSIRGLRQAVMSTLPVLLILSLVMVMSSIWMGAGTTAAMVSLGLQWASARSLLVASFICAAGVSLLLGSAIGTLSTVGLAFITMAATLGVPSSAIGGALVAGALIGDRTAFVSGNFHLAAAQSGAQPTDTLRVAWRRLAPMLVLCLLAYGAVGSLWTSPHISVDAEISAVAISWPNLLPPVAVLLLAALKLPATAVLGSGIVIAIAQAGLSGAKWADIATWAWAGTTSIAASGEAITSGGLQAMMPIAIIIVSAATFSGTYEGSGMLAEIVARLVPARSTPAALSRRIALTSLITAMIACNQTLAVLLPARMFRPEAERRQVGGPQLAVTLLDSGALFAALVPWNQFALLSGAVIGLTPVQFAPYAWLPWLLIAANLINPPPIRRDPVQSGAMTNSAS